jgi:hypothetical protein
MHRAPDNAAADAAATLLLAPVLELTTDAEEACQRGRMALAARLYEQALAAAERAPDASELIIAHLVEHLRTTLISDGWGSCSGTAAASPPSEDDLRRSDEQALVLLRRSLALYYSRWRAGSLFTLTPQEAAFFEGRHEASAPLDYVVCALHAVRFWPALVHALRAANEERLRAVYGALRAALEMDARAGDGAQDPHLAHALITEALDSRAGGILSRLRSVCGMTCDEEAAIGELGQREARNMLASVKQRAVADVARNGLRRCALPSCGALEPHPKCYYLCGRCRGVAYCSAAHSKEDWKRHKREDDCKAAAGGS